MGEVVNLMAYRRARYVKRMLAKMRRGEIRLPTSAELLVDLKATPPGTGVTGA